LKYHRLQAIYIVELSKTAQSNVVPTSMEDDSKMPADATINPETVEEASSLPKSNAKSKRKPPSPSLASGTLKKASETLEIVAEEQIEDSDVEEEIMGDTETKDFDEAEAEILDFARDYLPQEAETPQQFDPKSWNFNVPPVFQDTAFTGKGGIQHTLSPDFSTPFDYFSLFIPVHFYTTWAGYTNLKANQVSEDKEGHARFWKPTSSAELKAFFAGAIWYSLLCKSTFIQHLKKEIDQDKLSYWFPSATRWEQIKRFIKLSDPTTDANFREDRMHRIRDLFDHFIAACKANFQPAQCIALDEAMKKFKGRCVFKQYIKNKPVKWGLKIYCVACSDTSYLCNAEFYLGKNMMEIPSDASVLQQTCVRLLRPFANHGRIVHIDNYYTSLPLLLELRQMNIRICGTIRTNRKGLCGDVIIRKGEETQLKKQPGFIRFASCDDISFVAWYDKRPVHLLTNAYEPMGDLTVEHWYPAKPNEAGAINGKIKREVPIPPAIHFYNQNMGGVDTFDQYRSYIKLELKSNKFWHPMMWFVFESALVNSWILYKSTMQQAGLECEYTHFTFRKAIALALASEWESWGCSPKVALESPSKVMRENHGRSARQRFSTDTSSNRSNRYNCPNKHVMYKEKIPLKEGSKSNKRQVKCSYCKESRTSYWCKECRAPLCARENDCFILYHTR
jgi:Transposase IS4